MIDETSFHLPVPLCSVKKPLKAKINSKITINDEQAPKNTSCVLCNIIKNGKDITGRKPYVLYQNENFISTVDLGSMIEGYALIICKNHINSMGELTEKEFDDFDDIQNYVRKGLKKIYNKDCICFEHGSGRNNQSGAASSIKHAHFHMVAIDKFNDKLHNKIINDLEMFEIESQCGLKNYADEPYVYYITGDDTKYISTKKCIESQYLRKKIAQQFDKEWNWKNPEILKTFEENVLSTEQKWKKIINEDLNNLF